MLRLNDIKLPLDHSDAELAAAAAEKLQLDVAAIRELRDLTRYRKALIQDRTREANRLHKLLEDAGLI